MKYFKLKYENGEVKIVKGETALDIIQRYGLSTKEHVGTRIFELNGEQGAIARANDEPKRGRTPLEKLSETIGLTPDGIEELLFLGYENCRKVELAVNSHEELFDVILAVMPFIEDAKHDPAYKPEYVRKLLKRIQTVITKTDWGK